MYDEHNKIIIYGNNKTLL